MFSCFSFPGRLICLHAEGNAPRFPRPPCKMFFECFSNRIFCFECKTANKRFPGDCVSIFCCSVTCQVTELYLYAPYYLQRYDKTDKYKKNACFSRLDGKP